MWHPLRGVRQSRGVVLLCCNLVVIGLIYWRRCPVDNVYSELSLVESSIPSAEVERIRRFSANVTLESELSNLAGELNESRLADTVLVQRARLAVSQIIIYNRLPKCGSTTVERVVRYLQRRNNFAFLMSEWYDKFRMPQNTQMHFTNWIMTRRRPFLYDRHLYFVDFSKFGHSDPPVYINIVRDPLERMISQYYYLRRKGQEYDLFSGPESERNYTFDEYVAKGTLDGLKFSVPFFCGQDDFCLNNWSPESLAIAKRNVVRHFAVVGITEEFGAFFEALEYVAPAFFKGAREIYSKKNFRENEGHNKVPPSKKTKELVKDYLRYEYDFYHFIVQRFHNLMSWIHQDRNRNALV